MQLNTYLSFDGQCEAAFKFYEQCFGSKIQMMMKNGESPMADQMPPGMRDRVMHVSLPVGSNVLMGGDAPVQHFTKPQGFCVQLAVDNAADAERFFRALAENGKVQMPLQKTFWSAAFGMLTDQFGIPWMINCEQPA